MVDCDILRRRQDEDNPFLRLFPTLNPFEIFPDLAVLIEVLLTSPTSRSGSNIGESQGCFVGVTSSTIQLEGAMEDMSGHLYDGSKERTFFPVCGEVAYRRRACISRIWLFLSVSCFSIVCSCLFLMPRGCFPTDGQLKHVLWTSSTHLHPLIPPIILDV